MDTNLRIGWTEVITAEDLDGHMLDIGQAKANAELARQMLEEAPIQSNAKLLIHGCGTAQILDYLGEFLRQYSLTFADFNENFLSKTRERIARIALKAVVAKDDIENTNITENFDGIIAILLLEHIDWEKGVASITKLNPQKIYLIIQEEDNDSATITINKTPRDSIRKFSEIASPKLIQRQNLIDRLANYGYSLASSLERNVPNGKKMTGLTFQKNPKNH